MICAREELPRLHSCHNHPEAPLLGWTRSLCLPCAHSTLSARQLSAQLRPGEKQVGQTRLFFQTHAINPSHRWGGEAHHPSLKRSRLSDLRCLSYSAARAREGRLVRMRCFLRYSSTRAWNGSFEVFPTFGHVLMRARDFSAGLRLLWGWKSKE